MLTTTKRCDMACEILQRTSDGDDLAPHDLYLVQEWINDTLNESGEGLFKELHTRVMAGTYVKPWMCGVEHLTQDHEGYVYWKGIHVEHYSHDNYEEKKKDAIELARRCLLLEALGKEVTCGHAIWLWRAED